MDYPGLRTKWVPPLQEDKPFKKHKIKH